MNLLNIYSQHVVDGCYRCTLQTWPTAHVSRSFKNLFANFFFSDSSHLSFLFANFFHFIVLKISGICFSTAFIFFSNNGRKRLFISDLGFLCCAICSSLIFSCNHRIISCCLDAEDFAPCRNSSAYSR